MPCLKESRPERQEVSRICNIEDRGNIAIKAMWIAALYFTARAFLSYPKLCAKGRPQAINCNTKDSSRIFSRENYAARLALRFDVTQLVSQQLDRFIPTDFLPLTFAALAAALQRCFDSIRIVEDFQACLTARAQSTAIN